MRRINKEQLDLAREAIKLFRKAEDHHLKHRCSFQCQEWFKFQNKACLKAMDFEVLDKTNLTTG